MRTRRWSMVLGVGLLASAPAVAAQAVTATHQTNRAGSPMVFHRSQVTAKPSSAPARTAPAQSAPKQSAPKQSTPTQSAGTQRASAPSASSQSTKAQSTQTTTVPAPAATSEAYALVLANLLAISHTKSSASGGGTSSTANVLEIGGKPLASQFGGTQSGVGSSSGHLIDLGQANAFRFAVAPWSASNSQSSSQTTANSIADLLILGLGNPSTSQSASLRVLQSQSSSTWTSGQSTGTGSTDGAILNLGGAKGVTVDLLHSQTSSSGTGSSYLISLNGNQIGSSGQTSGKCSITLPGLISLDCLTTSGGKSGLITTVGSGVAKVAVGSGAGKLTGGLFQTASGFGSSSLAASTSPSAGSASSAASAAPSAKRGSSVLAFTGVDELVLLVIVALMVLVGAGLVAGSRWPRIANRLSPSA